MNLHISPNDSTPLYQQIINQIKYMIASGQLQPGDILPPIRAMAETLIVNVNTVARAYRDLERDGFVSLQRGIGTTVNDVGSPLSEAEQKKILNDRAMALLSEASQMNVNLDDVIRILETCAEELNGRAKETGQ
jgi:GntR family transcriptional regulator